mgnify:CR=1 FL=1
MLFRSLNMKALKKNDMGVSPVIAVILMVAITVVLAGVVFLWAQSFTNEAGGGVENLNLRGSIDVNGINDGINTFSVLELEVLSGTIEWSEYQITIAGTTVYDVADLTTTPDTANGETTSAGQTGYFSVAAYSDAATPLTAASEYTIKIVNIGDNQVVWEDNIIATA